MVLFTKLVLTCGKVMYTRKGMNVMQKSRFALAIVGFGMVYYTFCERCVYVLGQAGR